MSTQITTVDKLVPAASTSTLTSPSSPSHLTISTTADDDSVVQEGWQKGWDKPPAQGNGMYPPNIPWLKTDGQFGIFETAKPFKNAKGEMAMRRVVKGKMEFNPPPLPTAIKGSLPRMASFFTTPVFFWRPVGVMEAKVPCPNANCPAPPGSFLAKSGYGDVARQVCGMRHNYTLLTERLKCNHCLRLRHQDTSTNSDDEQQQQQYRWHAYSPSILMNLATAVRSMFPAIICGKRAIDKAVVTLLSDRLNSVSMTKVHRVLQQGHDEWYTERRDLYQTLLYQAHTSSNSTSSQQGILPFIKQPDSYTPC